MLNLFFYLDLIQIVLLKRSVFFRFAHLFIISLNKYNTSYEKNRFCLRHLFSPFFGQLFKRRYHNPIIDPEPDNTIDRATVTANYADLVLANYQTSMVDAEALETALNTFMAAPTQASFDAAKEAWLT